MILNQSLPDLETVTHREYDLIPVDGYLADFVLRVRQVIRGTKEASVYLVQQLATASENTLHFLLLAPSGELYECLLKEGGQGWGDLKYGYCTCYAGRTHFFCKHRDALTDAFGGTSHE